LAVESSKVLTAQIYILKVAICEALFSYWLAKINAMKKFAKMLCCLHSQSSKELSANLQTKLA
jgi:hypothetical protein